MGYEKRKERRIKVSLPIKILFQNKEIAGKTNNLSRLGAYIEIGEEIPLGTALDITLAIPAYSRDLSLSGEIRCKGSIFRCSLVREENSRKYYGTGIFFTEFTTPADRDKLSRYIGFLILMEEKGVKEGVREWKQKREQVKAKKHPKDSKAEHDKQCAEILSLLKEALARLDEISDLLKSKKIKQG